MELFDRFLGRPSRDTFAQLLISTFSELASRIDSRTRREFCLLYQDDKGELAGAFNLSTMYREYC